LVGRVRFGRLVARPVPAHVRVVGARFDGNVTWFEFDPPFDRGEVLRRFEAVGGTAWTLHRVLLGDHVGEPTRQFHRVVPPLTTVWLYLNDEEGKGAMLAIP
jgi:hypothetical protein